MKKIMIVNINYISMSNINHNYTFKDKIIAENINYQHLLKDYQARVAELEQDNAYLKQQNKKNLMEIGMVTSRNLQLAEKKTLAEKELYDFCIKYEENENELNKLRKLYALEKKLTEELHIKYQGSQDALIHLHQAYEYEKQQTELLKAKTQKDYLYNIETLQLYTTEIEKLKLEIEDEKCKFAELLKVLSKCYEGIHNIIIDNNHFDIMYDLSQLLPS